MVNPDLQVCIFSDDQSQLNFRRKNQFRFFWGDSRNRDRLELIRENPDIWILFLDADCEISADGLMDLNARILGSDRSIVHLGGYGNPERPTYLQRVHNLIANAWIRHSMVTVKPALLGGCFLIYSNPHLIEKIIPAPHFWGAEDKKLAAQLVSVGYKLHRDDNLIVTHATSKKFSHFMKRAWLHGVNDVEHLQEKIRLPSPQVYWAALRNIERSDWPLVPAVALHFLIQKTAKLIRSFRLASNSAKLK